MRQFNFHEHPFEILDVLLVAILIYWVYLLLKETRAMRILYGIAVLAIIMLLGRLLQLQTLNFILTYVLAGLVVAIPVVFQPELRAALERLGRTRFVGEFGKLKKYEIANIVLEIISAVDFLSKNRQGAIIVLTRQTGLRDIIQTGVRLDAQVTRQLLINIFAPKTPLHDGAVIISGDKVIAANCWLPLPEQEFNFDLGTRHRAAAGITSETDAIVIVVSEETGKISLAVGGNLTIDLTSAQIKEFLINLLQHKIEGVAT
ncbi:TIGR00159 family protein [Candidatus Berkelbacteria bacterium RBG_13_40_8]|uniref:Diadenylate cyclase n=1 Tax=Candidatus Berkelbacteria bacterium RBG_13_40_8 TaxID=1797467 RepID=A0A1F5DMT8_9BACT|nr:MAG: TIGR00159 family protein [Candidatus Berkelbacteria bacterium RBG_13_40_8]